MMINLGATNWNRGLQGACIGGHLELAQLMITKGVNNWSVGLREACKGCHMKLVFLMISYGATYCYHCKKSIEYHIK
jgi:hypothetical protein